MTTETINMRTDAARKQRLQQAAELTNESLTSFVLTAAERRAEEVLTAARTTELPAEFFDAFFEALAPEPTAALTDAVRRLRTAVRREP